MLAGCSSPGLALAEARYGRPIYASVIPILCWVSATFELAYSHFRIDRNAPLLAHCRGSTHDEYYPCSVPVVVRCARCLLQDADTNLNLLIHILALDLAASVPGAEMV